MGVYEQDDIGKAKVEKFLSANYAYFSGSSFFDTELTELNQLCNESWSALTIWLFKKFKAILGMQLSATVLKEGA